MVLPWETENRCAPLAVTAMIILMPGRAPVALATGVCPAGGVCPPGGVCPASMQMGPGMPMQGGPY